MKPDASRSFAAGGSAGPAGRARSGPLASPGSVGQPRAGNPCAPARGTPHCSTAGRGRSRCTTALLAGTAHTRTSARSAPGYPWPQQPAPTPPLRAPKRLRSRCAQALDETRLSVQYFARTVLDTVGRGALNNCPVVLAAAPVLIPRAAAFYCSARRKRKTPHIAHRRRSPAAPVARRAPQACPRRRAGVACDKRTTAAVGKPCSRH